MSEKIDPASLKQLRDAVDAVPPQTSPRAAKALTDLKAGVERLERDGKAGNDRFARGSATASP